MHFDDEGHIIVSPREIQAGAIADRARLINSVLIPGTPRAIPTHGQHHDLLGHISGTLGIHPSNLFFKGSTKIGFSIAPRPAKIWMEFGPTSDLDLAIVDPFFFQMVDSEVRQWEWRAANRGRIFQDRRLLKEYTCRNYHKGKFDCFRFFDLPAIDCMRKIDDCLRTAPVQACCGVDRSLTAFIFRDWWGVSKKYEFDLYCVERGLRDGREPLPAGLDEPRPYLEILESEGDRPVVE